MQFAGRLVWAKADHADAYNPLLLKPDDEYVAVVALRGPLYGGAYGSPRRAQLFGATAAVHGHEDSLSLTPRRFRHHSSSGKNRGGTSLYSGIE